MAFRTRSCTQLPGAAGRGLRDAYPRRRSSSPVAGRSVPRRAGVPATCNAGVKCSVYRQRVKQLREGSADFIRAMLVTGRFVGQSRLAYLNESLCAA